MVKKVYNWTDGAILDDHSRCKHRILRDYFNDYMKVRCGYPKQEKFKIAIVDGFCGGGIYKSGDHGSPLIFLEGIVKSVNELNLQRKINKCHDLIVDCLFIFNDSSKDAIESLKNVIAPYELEARESCSHLNIKIVYFNDEFDNVYCSIKEEIDRYKIKSVLFNLDQCGYKQVDFSNITDMMISYPGAEIFYTFVIEALLAFLKKSDPAELQKQLNFLSINPDNLSEIDDILSNNEWLGIAERIVFIALKKYAPFVSTFSIKNPEGWRYWLIHFANNYRARQVYNNILHNNSSCQAHFGRSGLDMLSYNPNDNSGSLYLFDMNGRSVAKEQLIEDIPKLISDEGDVMEVGDFYQRIYNQTPAHSDDINAALIENPDIEVISENNNKRRSQNTIKVTDKIKINDQRSFFSSFS